MKTILTSQQIKNLHKGMNDPLWFVKTVIRVREVFDYQAEVLKAIAKSKKVAWRSGHGVGKTSTAAWVVLWFLFTRPHSKVITTASSWRQVSKQLWPEIHLWARQADWSSIGLDKDRFEMLNLMIKLEQDWFATGEASDEPAKMEGFHAPSLLYVIDEGKSVPDLTYEAIEGALTNSRGEAKQLIISTPPPQMAGYFYDVFSRKRAGYQLFHTRCQDSPLVSKDWIEERKNEWGEDSPVYQTRVLGEFSESGEDLLIPLRWIEAAVEKLVEEGQKEIGADVARFGDDKTVFCLRVGKKVDKIVQFGKEDTMSIVGRLKTLIDERKPSVVRIDEIGVGAGVVDRLKEQGYEIEGVNVGEKASNSEKFINLRAEVYWGLRERFQQGDISIPNDDDLIAQLSNIKYKYTSRGQLQIESKEEMKKRGLKSPDKADALVLAFCPLTKPRPELYIP